MAITITNLNSAKSIENVTTHAIASFTLPANRLGLISVVSSFGGAEPPQPTIPNWTVHLSHLDAPTPNGVRRVTLFRRVVTVDTTEALTVSFGGANQSFVSHSTDYCDANAVITGTNGADGIVQALGYGNIHSPTINATPTLTALAAFANVNNASFSFINIGYQANLASVGTDFTLLSTVGATGASNFATITQWKVANDTVHELTVCTNSADMFVGMAAEINHVNFQGKAARLLM